MFFPEFQTLEGRTLFCGEQLSNASDDAPQAAAALVVSPAIGYYPGGGNTGGNTGGDTGGNTGGNTVGGPNNAQRKPRTFRTKLNGASEVPARATRASGNAEFVLSRNGKKINFVINVTRLRNVVDAHLHLGQPGQNGGVVVHLLGPFAPGGGLRNGRLVKGTLTGASLTGGLSGQKLAALVRELRAGNIYVNIHTNNGAGPIDTGPGDFASGEIRGQLKAVRK